MLTHCPKTEGGSIRIVPENTEREKGTLFDRRILQKYCQHLESPKDNRYHIFSHLSEIYFFPFIRNILQIYGLVKGKNVLTLN
ncbi:MAG: hypothetical protein B1H40_02350 [Candidatus Latescibacteria bacterium 4484_181]|nr:MAG: hypothetical protein B1H40_02350 [Candidatus Latescibacteria bacterium 4484_181]